ncbi:hypothetical protein B4U45_15785 [Mycobacterium persicum]|uniref:GTPase n=1 Tax=Mycobacterium persicum TaxID=1487726 RepID=A0A8E2IY83_9MYCO|nr:hypothetical protein [Mycobacterium persicum]KZS86214.1 hypothetical protein A4G31_14960 [Mycobacterium persicum]ORB95869.1 hypothetical protein B1T44_16760 [Mycobacterium persicum]ORC02580.1 hypothetical protein B1T48_16305 [Mycobacterium persicum]ORC07842.1 hypothetical protein B4U45_15785 [Mycobacterium persicum]VAZ70875.1 hypothetical protein LAUMK15_00506 [Mycobacterium persicum]
MTGQGYRLFVDELTRLAGRTGDRRVQPIAARVAEPLRVAVRGRPGTGCRTVAHALRGAGLAASVSPVSPASVADVQLYVLAEALKPEDRDAIAAVRDAGQPLVIVLNKADLSGFGGAGPMAAAQTRCAHFSALVGLPVVPMIGLLAAAAFDDLDETCWPALRALAAHPDGLTCLGGSFDGFLAAELTVSTPMRMRLLEALDLFGIALGVAAVRRGVPPAGVRALLRRASGVDAVVAGVMAAGAPPRYRRILEAVTALEAMAVTDERIARCLSGDDMVLARMSAALDAVSALHLESEGIAPENMAALLRRAVRWQHHRSSRDGRAGDLPAACGADIVRGSLRLWSRAGGSAESGECG